MSAASWMIGSTTQLACAFPDWPIACHAISCLAARGGRLHRPDDAQGERRETGVTRPRCCFPRASGCWFATNSIVSSPSWLTTTLATIRLRGLPTIDLSE
jgi:hypothetical protein